MDEDLKKIYDEKDCYVIYYEKNWNLKINVGKIRKVVKKNRIFSTYYDWGLDKDIIYSTIIIW